MEPLTPSKRLIAISLAVTLTATAGIVAYFQLSKKPLSQMTRPDLPMLDLTVKLLNVDDQELDAAGSRIGDIEEVPAGDERCPALSGGDISSATVVSSDLRRPADCPRKATWTIKKHPVAFTLYFNQGQTFLNWWDSQPQIKTLLDNRFSRGLFFGLLQSLKVKAEQLNLQGLQGEFLAHLLRDAIAANAELHYDMAHGNRGWVLSYLRHDSAFAEQALPAMAGLLAGSGYRVPKLPEPILEMKIGFQQFFLTEYQHRIYLAQSLEAMLNVIDSVLPMYDHDPAPLNLTVRTEAFINHLLPVLTGSPTWNAQFNFDLKDGKLGGLVLPAGPWTRQLHGTLFEGVLASIPHDAFAAVAASLRLPPTLTVDDWRKVASEGPSTTTPGPEPGGLALVWDFDADNPRGAIGVIVANPAEPQASQAYQQYLRNAELSAECAGGSVFLAATSQGLLTRMKEACARQSLSILDWQRGSDKQRFSSAQLMTFVNPGAGIRELFLAGGAGNAQDANEFSPRWQQDYEKAKAAMRQDGDKLFDSLPIFSYAGKVSGDSEVSLEGKWVAREVVK
ncbi:hypothetical protein IVG45_10230 [Methylomonas sp. LL1]|uniref:hypothetical protein n=1 Tax=Methylomonas sp. LL1 TaxID=2785785 RepID=UPI0018C383DD|nr:hypothetical protein [Methylomonas sp. LL1]QPK65271.1 hypothetical protein IVG45_10230 [Methylomonas sp. LL1]